MKVLQYLHEHNVRFESHEHAPGYTAQQVASHDHVSGKLFAKPVIVSTDAGFVMCVLQSHQRLDLDKVGALLGAQQVRLAYETEMAKLFPDAEIGAEAPFGQLYQLPTLVDEGLTEDAEISFQADDHRHSVRMRYADYEELARPRVANIAVHL